MKRGYLSLLLFLTLMLFTPFVYGITFVGPINYIGTHGGIVHFDQTFQATRLNYANGLNNFVQFVWGGTYRGHLGIDADTGVNVTVTGVTRDSVYYTVYTALPGNVDTYLYYYRNVLMAPELSEPEEVTGGTYTYSGGITTITTSGSPVDVIVAYGLGSSVSTGFTQATSTLIALMSLLILSTFISDLSKGTLGMNTLWKSVILIALLGTISFLFRRWGY